MKEFYAMVSISTAIILILSAILSLVLTVNYAGKRVPSLILWSAGMYIFSISVALELLFSFGAYSQFMIGAYLLPVAVLVELLAGGSVLLLHKKWLNYSYLVYGILSTAFLVYALATSGIGDILTGGVVYGALPVMVDIGSAIVTSPAAVLLVLISVISYRKKKDSKLLSIIAGVVVVSIAGTLYIAAFPAFLYYAEFAGILLLWFGFVDLRAVLGKRCEARNKALN